MRSWFIFWNTIFLILTLVFIINNFNFLSIILFSEYTLSVLGGSINDDTNLYPLSFFLLTLTGLEFSIGMLILLLFKNFKVDVNFSDNNDLNSIFFFKSKSKFFLNNYLFKKDVIKLLMDYSNVENLLLKNYPSTRYSDVFYNFFEDQVF